MTHRHDRPLGHKMPTDELPTRRDYTPKTHRRWRHKSQGLGDDGAQVGRAGGGDARKRDVVVSCEAGAQLGLQLAQGVWMAQEVPGGASEGGGGGLRAGVEHEERVGIDLGGRQREVALGAAIGIAGGEEEGDEVGPRGFALLDALRDLRGDPCLVLDALGDFGLVDDEVAEVFQPGEMGQHPVVAERLRGLAQEGHPFVRRLVLQAAERLP